MTRTIKALVIGGALAIGGMLFVPAAGAQPLVTGCAPAVQSINLNAQNVSFHPELDNVSFNEATSGISVNLALSSVPFHPELDNISYNVALGQITSVNGQQCR